MELVKYSTISENQYEDYIQEWELEDNKIVPSAAKRNDKSFKELVCNWEINETNIMFEKGFVPSTLYFFLNENNRIVGAIHHRHVLNDRLQLNGGHLGYGIKPTERKKGYATIMLSNMLNKLWKQGAKKILITCDDDNVASSKTIEKNGGELLDKPMFEGILTRRYWIYSPNQIHNNDT